MAGDPPENKNRTTDEDASDPMSAADRDAEGENPGPTQLAGWQRAMVGKPGRATNLAALLVGVVCVAALLIGLFTIPPPERPAERTPGNTIGHSAPALVLDPPPSPDATRDQLLVRDRAQRAELAELRAELRRLQRALQAAQRAAE